VYFGTCSADFSQFLVSAFFTEMSTTEEMSAHDYNFIVIGGGIAGVTCVETVSYFY